MPKNQHGRYHRLDEAEREKIRAAFRADWGWTRVQETFKRGQGVLVKLRREALGKRPPKKASTLAPSPKPSAVIDARQWSRAPKPAKRKPALFRSPNQYRRDAAGEILQFLAESKEVTEAGKRLLRAALEVMP